MLPVHPIHAAGAVQSPPLESGIGCHGVGNVRFLMRSSSLHGGCSSAQFDCALGPQLSCGIPSEAACGCGSIWVQVGTRLQP